MGKVTLVVLAFLCWTSALGISLNNGAYEDLYIVIQDTVPEDVTIITRIKDIFTEASSKLFIATLRRVYFGKIKIIVPRAWSDKPGYRNIPKLSPLESSIHVDNGNVKTPHVRRRTGGCGNPGHYMYLHTGFILTTGSTDWGLHSNVIVHEWGHLRWGLYDEYARGAISHFYQAEGEWKPVSCTKHIKGTVTFGTSCSNPNEIGTCDLSNTRQTVPSNCRFCPSLNQEVDASLMGFQFIEKMWGFCDANTISTPATRRHNSVPATEQNVQCDRKSAWEVMRDLSDFQTGSPLSESTNTIPEFEILRDTVKYRVFVLDISGSMNNNGRLTDMFTTSQYIIDTIVKFDSWLGIVTFSSEAHTVIHMTEIKGQSEKDTLKAALPTSADGSTCIGCGIELAIELLKTVLTATEGADILVLSDGQNNRGNLTSSVEKAVNARVVVHTIAISQVPGSSLADIAHETGGKHFSHLEVVNGSSSLAASFAAAVEESASGFNSNPATLVSEKIQVVSRSTMFTFNIEEDIGLNTTIAILTNNPVSLYVQLVTPDGTVLKKNDNSSSYATLDVPGMAEPGKYIVNITVLEGSPSTLEYRVTSHPGPGHPIRVSSRLSTTKVDFSQSDVLPKILTDVVKGEAPVLNVTVTALVETNTVSCEISLRDNGVDPDETLNDGTYTGYIQRSCLDNKRINIKVYAKGEGGSTSMLLNPFGALPVDVEDDRTKQLNSSFQRVSLYESLTVENFVRNTNDITPPNRITDVDVIDVTATITEFGESRNFSITWTAPGDDFSEGQATEYEFRFSDNIDTLTTNFSEATLLNLPNANFTPAAAGETETLTIMIDATETFTNTTYFAIVTRDEANNTGRVSNIVSIVVADGYRLETAEYVPQHQEDEPVPAPTTPGFMVLIIVSCTFGAVFLMLLFVMIVVVKRVQRTKSKTKRLQSHVNTGFDGMTEPEPDCIIGQGQYRLYVVD